MKAMILAAGKGTRVQPLTHTTPKPMLRILDIPVLEILILKLKAHGFNEIVINTSHLSHDIEEYFNNGHKWGVSIRYSFEGIHRNGIRYPEAIGSAAGIQKIQKEQGFFDDSFLVICGDAIIDADLSEAMDLHKKSNCIASLLLKNVDLVSVHKYGIVELDTTNNVRSFQEKPSTQDAKSTLANTGIYIFEPEVLQHIPQEGAYDIGGDLFPKLVQNKISLHGISLPFQWIDIGTLEDYYKANLMALENKIHHLHFSANRLEVNYEKAQETYTQINTQQYIQALQKIG